MADQVRGALQVLQTSVDSAICSVRLLASLRKSMKLTATKITFEDGCSAVAPVIPPGNTNADAKAVVPLLQQEPPQSQDGVKPRGKALAHSAPCNLKNAFAIYDVPDSLTAQAIREHFKGLHLYRVIKPAGSRMWIIAFKEEKYRRQAMNRPLRQADGTPFNTMCPNNQRVFFLSNTVKNKGARNKMIEYYSRALGPDAVTYHHYSQDLKGYGFMSFSTPEQAAEALRMTPPVIAGEMVILKTKSVKENDAEEMPSTKAARYSKQSNKSKKAKTKRR